MHFPKDLAEDRKIYEQSQEQRQFEREIRELKCRILTTEAANDPDGKLESQLALKKKERELKEFLAETHRGREQEREQVHEFGRSEAQKAVWADKEATHKRYSKHFGTEKMSETLETLSEIRHNDRDSALLDSYEKAVEKGDINALTGFKVYRETANEVEAKLVGTTTANGVDIKGYKHHFIDRIIGQHAADDIPHAKMRRGVTVDQALDALLNPMGILRTSIHKVTGKKSQAFTGLSCMVSVNPDTGELIQTNPINSKGGK